MNTASYRWKWLAQSRRVTHRNEVRLYACIKWLATSHMSLAVFLCLSEAPRYSAGYRNNRCIQINQDDRHSAPALSVKIAPLGKPKRVTTAMIEADWRTKAFCGSGCLKVTESFLTFAARSNPFCGLMEMQQEWHRRGPS